MRETFVFKAVDEVIRSNFSGVLENERMEIETKHEFDIGLIDEVLALTRNIHQTYAEAPDYLKRHYLRFFFEGFEIKDKKIVKVIETPILSTLRKEHQLLIRQTWLRG